MMWGCEDPQRVVWGYWGAPCFLVGGCQGPPPARLSSQCLYGCYVHSSIVPTFHRRCYWLLQVTCGGHAETPPKLHWGVPHPPKPQTWLSCLPLPPQNPDIVLVHYLNVPAMEECSRPCAPPLCAGSPPLCAGGPPLCTATADPREWLKWSQEELVAQLRPMCKWGGGVGYPQKPYPLLT